MMNPRRTIGIAFLIATTMLACGSDDSSSPTITEGGGGSSTSGGDERLCEDDEACAEQFEATRELLDFQCSPQAGATSTSGTEYHFDFELGAQATSFLMVPVVSEGVVVPLTLQTPETSLDLIADYRHHNAQLLELENAGASAGSGALAEIAHASPILVPYAPQFDAYAQPGGAYELTVSADEATPCLYILESDGGTTLDLNVYVATTRWSGAEEARSDADLDQILERVAELFEPAGVEIGRVRFGELPEQVRDSYRIIRSENDVYRLTGYGEAPDDSLDGHLSVDLFLVDDMRLGGVDILGLSGGLPGAAGLHGNARNGLVFQTTDVGSDNPHVAHLLAHELGHFLGLRHTTEIYKDTGTSEERLIEETMGITDPIEDTPECDDIQSDGFDCVDVENLMFPAAPPTELGIDAQWSEDQASVLRANPLIK